MARVMRLRTVRPSSLRATRAQLEAELAVLIPSSPRQNWTWSSRSRCGSGLAGPATAAWTWRTTAAISPAKRSGVLRRDRLARCRCSQGYDPMTTSCNDICEQKQNRWLTPDDLATEKTTSPPKKGEHDGQALHPGGADFTTPGNPLREDEGCEVGVACCRCGRGRLRDRQSRGHYVER